MAGTTGQQTGQKTEQPGKRVAIYRRVSSGKQQAEGESLGSQQADCMKWCRERGHKVVLDIYDVQSGDDFDERPALSEVRRRMWRREFDILLVWRWDRLSRNPDARTVLGYEASKYGIELACVTQETDDSPMGKMQQTMYAIMAQAEREAIRQRVMRGQQRRVELGKPLNQSQPPYGYAWGDKKKTRLVPHPEHGPVAIQIWTWVAEGQSYNNVRKLLFAAGIPARGGKPVWTVATLQKILGNPIYYGEGVNYKGTRVKTRIFHPSGEMQTVKRHLKTPERHVPIPHSAAPPLISKALAEQALAGLQARYQSGGRPTLSANPRPEAYLLRGGIIRCGHCGEAMVGSPMKKHKANGTVRLTPYYRCVRINPDKTLPRPGIAAHLIDPVVWEAAMYWLSHLDSFEASLQHVQGTYGQAVEHHLAAIDAEMARLRSEQRNLSRAIASLPDGVDASVLLTDFQTLGEALAAQEATRVQAANEEMQWEVIQERLAGLRDIASRNITATSYDERRAVLRLLGANVFLYVRSHTPQVVVRFNPLQGTEYASSGSDGKEGKTGKPELPNLSALASATYSYRDESVQMEPTVYGLKTGIFSGSGQLVFNRFTGPGRVGIQSMYYHMPSSEEGNQQTQSSPFGGIFNN